MKHFGKKKPSPAMVWYDIPWPLSGCIICPRAHRSVMMARHRRIGYGKSRGLKCSLGQRFVMDFFWGMKGGMELC